MMNFGNFMNFGFGYNPFAMGNFVNPNFNFFSANTGYASYTPFNMSYSNPLFCCSGFGQYNSFSPYGQYNLYNNNLSLFSQPYYQPSAYTYGMYPQQPFNSMALMPRPNFFNMTNPITTPQITKTETNENQAKYKEKEIDKTGDDYGPEFLKRVKEVAKNINCDYKDLLGVMNSESGINSKAQNKNGGATGLIQFMPKTAEMLGTSTEELKAMSPIEQLDYVEKCLLQCKKMAKIPSDQKLSGGQLYALVFLPARANREVLTTSNENYYKANKGLDANKDGKITKTELDERVARFHVSDKSFLA
jgi:hypothetical protein